MENIAFDNFGRMKFNPSFHPNQGKHFSDSDLEYLCKYYDYDSPSTIALALGRTEQSVTNKILQLKRLGLYEYYKNQNKFW
jgi:Mn-dependent DtxR family transcriptional regulator